MSTVDTDFFSPRATPSSPLPAPNAHASSWLSRRLELLDELRIMFSRVLDRLPHARILHLLRARAFLIRHRPAGSRSGREFGVGEVERHAANFPAVSLGRPCSYGTRTVLDGARTELFGRRTRARRIQDFVVQSKNLASRLCDLIVTHRFDGNFRIELLSVRQGVAQLHELGLLRYWQFRILEIAQVVQVCVF